MIAEDREVEPGFAKQDATVATVALAVDEDGPVAITASSGDSRAYLGRARPVS